MSPLVKLSFSGNLATIKVDTERKIAAGATTAILRMQTRALVLLRQDMRAGQLGDRLAKSWQAKKYPVSGRPSMTPATLVYSKAPQIVQAFSSAETIRSIEGTFLAIPTDNVPLVSGTSGRRHASVRDVQLLYGEPVIKPAKNGNLLLFVNAIAAKNGRGFKPTTKRRAKARPEQLVLMFVLVRQVRLQKRLNWPAIFADLESEWPDVLGHELEISLRD